MANEDIPYTSIDDFAVVEKKEVDPDQPNASVVKDVAKYLEEVIKEHNSLDLIDLTEQAKMTPTQQIAVHRYVLGHLRNIKAEIDNKIKELI
jgi:hypothetical protein